MSTPDHNLGLSVLHVEQPERGDRGRVFPSTMKAGLQLREQDNTQVGIEQRKGQHHEEVVAR